MLNVIVSLTSGNWIAICSIFVVVFLAFLGFLGRILYKQGSLEAGFTSIDHKIDKLDEKFDKFILQPLATNKSPLRLTEKGKEIFERPKIEEFVSGTINEITFKMKETSYDSAYQAQERLFVLVDSYKNSKYKISLENEAFETGLHVDILMKTIAVGIRDKVFEVLDLKIEDIDHTDPTKKD